MPLRSPALPIALACLMLAAWLWLPASAARSLPLSPAQPQDDPAPYLANLHAEPSIATEGSPLLFSAAIVEPGTAQEYNILLAWGDGVTQALNYPAGTASFTLTHTYSDDMPSNTASDLITITADLEGAAEDSPRSLQVSVANVPPQVHAGGDEQINQGELFARAGSFSDPGADQWIASVDYGAGDGAQPLALDSLGFTLTHTYAQPGVFSVTVRILDDDHGLGTGSFTLTVRQTQWEFILPMIFR